MKQFLVFQLHGAMAAWGDIAVGETRPSSPYPSKSAILGLLAAACGIERQQEKTHEEMATGYGVAVKVLSGGTLLMDYHTVQVPPQRRQTVFRTRKEELLSEKLGTLLSSREYRCDAVYIVAAWVAHPSAPFPLRKLAAAIEKPVYHLYLGRKSCPPGSPLCPVVVEEKDLKTALDAYSAIPAELARITHRQTPRYYWDDLPESGLEAGQIIERRDLPLSRKRWQFSPRLENLYVQTKET